MDSPSSPEAAKMWSKIVVKWLSAVALATLVLWQSACGGGTLQQPPNSGTPAPPGDTPSGTISISPASALVGSPDLTLTIAGSNTFTFAHHCTVVWSQSGIDTQLSTTLVSSSELTAAIPASLLASPVTASIHVEIWEWQGDDMKRTVVATSRSVPFDVASSPPSIPAPSISSIAPSTVSAGSSDVTITRDGSNFGHFGHFVWSTAFRTTNWNLHDTGSWLQTTIVSSGQLTAVIPAKLLQSPTSVQVVVMNGDVTGMTDGYFGYPRSNSVRLR